MKVIETSIQGCLIIEPAIFQDDRGYFFESFQKERYASVGISPEFVQDNRSLSKKNVLRGLHYQVSRPQGKLVSVLKGEVLDVAVDLRQGSTTFGQHEKVILSGSNHRQLYIPPGFAHGFLVLSDQAEFFYKCTDYYDPLGEAGLLWSDSDLDIDWGCKSPELSLKDANHPTLADYVAGLDND